MAHQAGPWRSRRVFLNLSSFRRWWKGLLLRHAIHAIIDIAGIGLPMSAREMGECHPRCGTRPAHRVATGESGGQQNEPCSSGRRKDLDDSDALPKMARPAARTRSADSRGWVSKARGGSAEALD